MGEEREERKGRMEKKGWREGKGKGDKRKEGHERREGKGETRYTNTSLLPAPLALGSSSSAIAERSCCGVGKLWPKVEDWNWETILTNIIDLDSPTVTYLTSKAIEFGE